MKSWVVKFIVVLLFSAYLADTSDILVHVETYLHRQSIIEKIKSEKESDLTAFVFSLQEYSSLNWHKPCKEFELNGKLFDIKNIKFLGTTYQISAKNDSKEVKLNEIYNSLAKNRKKLEKLKEKKVYTFTHSKLTFTNTFAILPVPNFLIQKIERQPEIEIPPPRNIV